MGIWKQYSDGKLSEIGRYEQGKKTGVWKKLNGDITLEEMTYEDGLRNGSFMQYDSLGQLVNKGIFKADTIMEQTNPSNTKSAMETMPSVIPCPDNQGKLDPCSEKLILSYIYQNVRYPMEAKKYDVQGRAIVSFTIKKDGHIGNIKVLRGLCDPIKEELIRLVSTMDERLDFRPGTRDGVKVDVNYIVPVKFSLE